MAVIQPYCYEKDMKGGDSMLEFKSRTFSRTMSNEQFSELEENDYVYYVEEFSDRARMEMIRVIKRDEEMVRHDEAVLEKKVIVSPYINNGKPIMSASIGHNCVNRTIQSRDTSSTIFTDEALAFSFFKKVCKAKKALKSEVGTT